MNSQPKIGFVGLGKLGLPCAETMATVYDVVGYDIYPKTSDKIKIADNLEEAVRDKDIIFIAAQTPHEVEYDGSRPISHLPNKDFDYSIVENLLKEINVFMRKEQLVVLISTVLPGTVRKRLLNSINCASFAYNPYLIAMGSVNWDMVNPEMVIIGTQDADSNGIAKKLIDFYKPLMQNDPKFVVGTYDEAECIKIFYNTFISTKLSLVNMIQDVAEKNKNINVDVVTDALANSNLRIMSGRYMKAGMGDAGPCHPRDNIALRWLADNLHLGYNIFDAIIKAREIQAKNLADYLIKLQKKHFYEIIIHGKTYKPEVDILDGSYSLLIGHYLQKQGAEFRYADPNTKDTVKNGTVGIILLAHNNHVTYGYTGVPQSNSMYFVPGSYSVIVDPWRSFKTDDRSIQVIHYGNTRDF